MKRVPVLAAFVAAMYMLFVVFYSSKVVYYAIALPTPLISERSLRPISAIKRDSGANSVFVGIASKAEAVGAAAKAHDASSIASWCLRMQKEGDMIARSFDGGARFNFDACFIVCSRPLEVIPLRIQPGNLGKNECWGEKGSRTFLSRFIDIQVKLAASSSSDSASRVIIDAGCNKGDYVAELSPLLSSGALGATKMPDVIYHGFEAMPQNCKFIEQVPLVVKLGKRVHLHCCALGDSDGTVEFETSGIIGDEGAKMHAAGAVSASTAGNTKTLSVPLRKLDSFASEIQADGRIILLKVDSEGAEGRIFTGGQQLLQTVDVVLFEIGETWYRTPSIWNVRDAAMFWAKNGFMAFRLGVDKLFRFDGSFYRSTHDKDGNVALTIFRSYWGNGLAIRRNSPLSFYPHHSGSKVCIRPPDALLPNSDWSTFSSVQETCPPPAVPEPCIWHPNVSIAFTLRVCVTALIVFGLLCSVCDKFSRGSSDTR